LPFFRTVSVFLCTIAALSLLVSCQTGGGYVTGLQAFTDESGGGNDGEVYILALSRYQSPAGYNSELLLMTSTSGPVIVLKVL